MPLLRSALAASLAAALLPPALAASPEEHAACLQRLQPAALRSGVSAETYASLTAPLRPDESVLESLDYQPEFRTPIWDYLAGLVDEERVQDGLAAWARWREVLNAVEARYGVPAHVVVAVWGVESNFGRNYGSKPLLQSLSTLSCFGRRQEYFRGEFFTALKIVQAGHISAERLVGSWAGAFGQTQFMPSTFMETAQDFDGDGRRDLMDSVPDALASTARFLQQANWQSGEGWGYEVRLPAGFNEEQAGRKRKQPLKHWAALGVKRIDGSPLPGEGGQAAILLPAGGNGPAFLVFRNFDAIYRYNAAESYALAIAHLSDRLLGGGPFATPWPTDDAGISRAERREVQTLLLARGHDIGAADGMIGARTREAIKLEQARLGMEADGRAGQKLLAALRAGR